MSRNITSLWRIVRPRFIGTWLSPANLLSASEGSREWYIYDVGGSRGLVSIITFFSAMRPPPSVPSQDLSWKDNARAHDANQMDL